MISLSLLFWIFIVMFAIIGAMRGWAKELLVMFSVILAIFVITVLKQYVPFVSSLLQQANELSFWIQTGLLLTLSYFGYQSPNFPRLSGGKLNREKLQDSLFGAVLGGFNAYLIFGTLWEYLIEASYPFSQITPPIDEASLQLIAMLPLTWLVAPTIFFAVAIAFAFVVVVYL